MVKAEEVSILAPAAATTADFEIKFDDEVDLFNVDGYDLAQFNMTSAWCDDTPPDTPSPPSASLSPIVDGLLQTMAAKPVDTKLADDWDYVDFDSKPSNSASPSSSTSGASIMWNMDNEPTLKLMSTVGATASASTVASTTSASAVAAAAIAVATASSASSPAAAAAALDLARESLTASLELFADEDTSDDDIFREFSGAKRKAVSAPAVESMEAKKAKARQTRDAITAETQMRLLAATGTDSKRLTHNVLERKRRNDLKASYQELRETIPELIHQERAPTAQILSKGVEYIEFLKKNDASMMATITAMRAEIERNKAILIAAGRSPDV